MYLTLALWLWSALAYLATYQQRSASDSLSEDKQKASSGAVYRIIATALFSLVTLYYLWRENPLEW